MLFITYFTILLEYFFFCKHVKREWKYIILFMNYTQSFTNSIIFIHAFKSIKKKKLAVINVFLKPSILDFERSESGS